MTGSKGNLSTDFIKLIECPRDAMQGIVPFIPTDLKVKYINKLLQVGFDTIDFGSFVSPKAIPQLADTAEVLNNLDLGNSKSKLLAIIANQRGAENACRFEVIDYLGYPLSLSETFQQRNTNRSITTAFEDLGKIQEMAIKNNKTLVVYLSMGFGNPYGDPYDSSYIIEFVDRLNALNVSVISLADTVGVANLEVIGEAFGSLIPEFPNIEFGAHFHSRKEDMGQRLEAAWMAGCRRFDGAIKGFGGCPMAEDELVGNMATELMIDFFEAKNVNMGLQMSDFQEAILLSQDVFG